MNYSNGIKLVPIVSEEQIHKMCKMANRIWSEHYSPIIGMEQVEYMLNKFQSPESINRQMIIENYRCYFLNFRGIDAGYVMFKIENNAMFLSKIYIDKQYRGQKVGKNAVDFLADYCVEYDIDKIWLTVNKNNHSSIAAYEKMGFEKTDEQIMDIGMGYIMDDYIMEKRI